MSKERKEISIDMEELTGSKNLAILGVNVNLDYEGQSITFCYAEYNGMFYKFRTRTYNGPNGPKSESHAIGEYRNKIQVVTKYFADKLHFEEVRDTLPDGMITLTCVDPEGYEEENK